MPLTFTPAQLARRADFYHQLGQLTSAGLTVVTALEHIQRNPPAPSYRHPIQLTLQNLASGCNLSEAFQSLGQWLPEFDLALLRAGEQSGRLDSCFRALSEYYTERAQMLRQMLASLAYPAFLFHFAIFIFPFAELFTSGNWLRYFAKTFGVLLPIYVIVAIIIFAGQNRHAEAWRGTLEILLHPLPVLGTARRYLALSRLSAALEALISAGVTIIEAWELAATACGSPAIRRAVFAWRPLVHGGQTPSEVINASGAFPTLFAGQYAAGEISGKLDETLRRLHHYYQEEGSRKLRAVFRWTPIAIYLVVVFMIAYRVVSFWMGHFRDIGNALNF
jgi:type II secretory pathway component PulF